MQDYPLRAAPAGPWYPPVLAALGQLVAPVEATSGQDIVVDAASDHPWLQFPNWPLPAAMPVRKTPLLLAWRDLGATLYLTVEDAPALSQAVAIPQTLAAAAFEPLGLAQQIADFLQTQGWVPWADTDISAGEGPAEAICRLLGGWIQAVDTAAAKLASGSSRTAASTDLDRVREGLHAQGGTQAALRPIKAEALAQELARTVRGQPQALNVMAQDVAAHAGKLDPQCPAVIFATGTTGVGKTLAAMSLAPALNALQGLGEGDARRWRTVRLNMNEYQEPHRVSELRGAPAGYLGHGNDSALVSALREGPRCVVVFDEIEKAHPDILDTLMAMTDEGALGVPHTVQGPGAAKPGQGHVLNCREAILVFTSNLDDAGMVAEYHPDRDPDELDLALRRRLVRAGMRPELANRMGRCVVFLPIGDDARIDIALAEVEAAGREYGLQVRHVCPELLLQVLRQPAHNEFGARSDRRAVGRVVSAALLQGRKAGWKQVRLLSDPTRCEPCE